MSRTGEAAAQHAPAAPPRPRIVIQPRSKSMSDRRVRIFHDSGGIRWTAYERDAGDLPGSRARRCLVFESAAAVRRVWSFPDSWTELTDEQLAALSWRR